MFTTDKNNVEPEFTIYSKGKICFHCGDEVSDPAIQWIGNPDATLIHFHPECALRFAVRLQRDVWHAMKVEGTEVALVPSRSLHPGG